MRAEALDYPDFACTLGLTRASFRQNDMRSLLLLALAAGALHAGVIRGEVVEDQTGRRLAGAVVVAQPVAGTAGQAVTVRSDRLGIFVLPPVAGGAYLVSVTRRGFGPVEYGQKRWKASGLPVLVERDGSVVLHIRMPRFGAIEGSILDENEVGLMEHDVVAYRNKRPPVVAARARTDDRGMYRIYGLEPGSYVVRTLAKALEDGAYLPTFFRDSDTLDQAYPVTVEMDQQAENVNIHPTAGRLCPIGGLVYSSMGGVQTTVTLVSDMGTETSVTDSSGHFRFPPVAPGRYELYAVAPSRMRGRSGEAAWMPLTVDRDASDTRISLQPQPTLGFHMADQKGGPVDASSVRILARRRDLSGEGKPEILRPNMITEMLPGRWDLLAQPSENYYVSGFAGPKEDPSDGRRPDDWNTVVLSPGGRTAVVGFTLASNPGRIHGTVNASANSPAAGAPVFLEMYDVGGRGRLLDLRITRTDMRGQYHFYGLAPGTYRVMSSFDFQSPEPADMESAGAKMCKVEEGGDIAADLDLFTVR